MSDSKAMIVTGCASGIGRHLAEVLVARGHRLVACDIDQGGLDELCEECGFQEDAAVTHCFDVREPRQWKDVIDEAVERFGRLDVMMNVAGYLQPGFVHEVDVDQVDLHLDINAKGVIYGTRAAARQMVEQGAGHIINVGSLASLAPVPGLSLYTASKFAVRGFTLAAAQELRPHGVFVTAVLPDAVATPMLDLQADYEEAAMTFSGGRTLTVEDLEEVIVERVLTRRPLEVSLPAGRGTLARVANTIPQVSMLIGPLLRKLGLRRQEELKGD
jgi:3-oxoacyl-[acyl-carrier protein] reductase